MVLFLLLQLQRRGVHAITLPGRFGTIGEDVTEMATAVRAQALGPLPHEFAIALCGHGIFRHRLVETRPAASGFVLCLRAEQRVSAARAFVSARVMRIGILTGKGSLRPLFPKDVILLRGQFLPPFRLSLFDFVTHILSPIFAATGVTATIRPRPESARAGLLASPRQRWRSGYWRPGSMNQREVSFPSLPISLLRSAPAPRNRA